jgi:hypothetical protein
MERQSFPRLSGPPHRGGFDLLAEARAMELDQRVMCLVLVAAGGIYDHDDKETAIVDFHRELTRH